MVYKKEDQVQKVVDYIKKNLGKGYTAEALRWALINQGHSKTIVDKAVEVATKQLAAAAPKLMPIKEEKIEIVEEPKVESKKGFLERILGIFKK